MKKEEKSILHEVNKGNACDVYIYLTTIDELELCSICVLYVNWINELQIVMNKTALNS